MDVILHRRRSRPAWAVSSLLSARHARWQAKLANHTGLKPRQSEASNGDDARESAEITKGSSLELSRVDGSREKSSDAVRDEGEQRHSCLGEDGELAQRYDDPSAQQAMAYVQQSLASEMKRPP
jgi:hypothetical protein